MIHIERSALRYLVQKLTVLNVSPPFRFLGRELQEKPANVALCQISSLCVPKIKFQLDESSFTYIF